MSGLRPNPACCKQWMIDLPSQLNGPHGSFLFLGRIATHLYQTLCAYPRRASAEIYRKGSKGHVSLILIISRAEMSILDTCVVYPLCYGRLRTENSGAHLAE